MGRAIAPSHLRLLDLIETQSPSQPEIGTQLHRYWRTFMDYTPLLMMGIMGLIAGWIANQLVNGGKGDLASNLVTGVIGAFVGGYIQRYAKLDLMKLGNPLLEELAVAIMGAVAVIIISRIVAQPGRSR